MIEFKENTNVSKYLIKSIWFTTENGDEEIEVNYNKDDNKDKMYYINEYHGDHCENWVIQESNGKEKSRHNVKYIATIIWSDRLNL